MPLRLAIVLLAARALAPSGVLASRTPPEPALFGINHSEFRQRRAAAASAFSDGILVVRGTTEEESGEESKFRQNSWFFYLTGVEAPAAALLVDGAATAAKRERLYLPPRNLVAERWTGPQLGPGEGAATAYGFETVASTETLVDDVVAAVAARKSDREVTVYSIVVTGDGARFSRDAAFVERIADALGKSGQKFKIADARPALAELRRRKSDGELALLERAIAITGEAQAKVASVVRPNRFEYEAEAAIAEAFLRNGAARAGFPSIVGSGPYSTILHYAANTRKMASGDLVVVDIGAEYNYYTADITRTWPVSGKFTDRQRAIYSLVLDAQRAAEAAYRPGATMRDLHAAAVATFKSSPLRDAKGRTLESAFIHGLGHFVGLDVHDVGDYAKPLAPGDVITIEPGLYLADEMLGVRIEDDYLVTANGLVKLSKAIPSDVAEIERAMR
jgi:Xaa-Pro aminopeptidase